MKRFFLFFIVFFAGAAVAAEWQWREPVEGIVSDETKASPVAYLWIPPMCEKIRAVLVGQHNMEEELILEDSGFRVAMEKLGVAEVWITPAMGGLQVFTVAEAVAFEGLMGRLSEKSGYTELATVPVIPIGHSALASFPWHFAERLPKRTLACISVSGQWPFQNNCDVPPMAPDALDGIHGLVTIGEYEWAASRAKDGLAIRAAHPKFPLSFLPEAGAGHFDVSVDKLSFLALYIGEALKGGPGWEGNVPGKFWSFSKEQAKAADAIQAKQNWKAVQILGFRQNGKLVSQNKQTHQQVTLAFQPFSDGITFSLVPDYEDSVPAGRPERWTGKKAGEFVAHDSDVSHLSVKRICGPLRQVGPDRWQVCFGRLGFDNPRRSNDCWFFAEYSGSDKFRRIVQQAEMRIPLRNTEGAEQSIAFGPIPDQEVGTAEMKLAATASSGLPVCFYVREGPAEITSDGRALHFLQIPVRAKLPIAVTVVAWQYGRAMDSKVQSAEPILRTFCLKGRP